VLEALRRVVVAGLQCEPFSTYPAKVFLLLQ
jgi:hypothetical protein